MIRSRRFIPPICIDHIKLTKIINSQSPVTPELSNAGVGEKRKPLPSNDHSVSSPAKSMRRMSVAELCNPVAPRAFNPIVTPSRSENATSTNPVPNELTIQFSNRPSLPPISELGLASVDGWGRTTNTTVSSRRPNRRSKTHLPLQASSQTDHAPTQLETLAWVATAAITQPAEPWSPSGTGEPKPSTTTPAGVIELKPLRAAQVVGKHGNSRSPASQEDPQFPPRTPMCRTDTGLFAAEQVSSKQRQGTRALAQVPKPCEAQDEKRRFICDQCGLGFHQAGGLRNHINAVHLKMKPFACSWAGCNRRGIRGFAAQGDLTRHVSSVHRGERPHGCGLCDMQFARRSVLVRHLGNIHKVVVPRQRKKKAGRN